MYRKRGSHHIDAATKALKDVTDNRRLDDSLNGAVQQPALVVGALVPVVVTLLPLPYDQPPDRQKSMWISKEKQ